MNVRTNPSQTEQHRTAQLVTGRRLLWTAEWSIGRRIMLFLFGLFQQFLHAGFLRMLLVPGYEWLVPIDPFIYLQTEALALATSLGLLALPFVKSPGRTMRALLMASLALGALANAARMLSGIYMGDFWYPFTCDPQQLGMPCGDTVDRLLTDVAIHIVFGAALYLNLSFCWKLRKAGTRSAAG